MKTKMMIRQGDILLVRENVRPPKNIKPVLSVVLAEGELTGHAHVLTAETGVVAWDNMIWIVGDEPGALTHQDHDPVPAHVIPPGVTFRVVRQREFTLDEQWQPVQD